MVQVEPKFRWLLCLMWLGFLLWGSSEAHAQRNRRGMSKELGYQAGLMWYTGDLNPSNVFRGLGQFAQGGYYRHNLNTRISIRGQYMQGRIDAWDSDHPNAWQQRRNLHFRNQINEYALCFELNFRDHAVGNPKRNLVPFLYAGLAVFTHDPEGLDEFGNWQPLQPMGTEGQGWYLDVEEYLTWGPAIPYGLGWKGNLGTAMSFQLEWATRKLWTDYLDDVSTTYVNPAELRDAEGPIAEEFANRSVDPTFPSGGSLEGYQRGDPGRNDRYGYFLVSLGFRVSKKATTCWEQ